MAVAVAGAQDYIPELVRMSKANLDKDDETMLGSGRVHLKVSSERVGVPRNGWNVFHGCNEKTINKPEESHGENERH